MTASAYAVEPESGSAPAKPVEETPAEHQAALEKTGHKEWGKLKMAVKVEKRFHEKHKHKIICGTCALITTIIIIILVVALAVAAAVYFTRQPSSSEMALQAKSQNAIVNIGTQSVSSFFACFFWLKMQRTILCHVFLFFEVNERLYRFFFFFDSLRRRQSHNIFLLLFLFFLFPLKKKKSIGCPTKR